MEQTTILEYLCAIAYDLSKDMALINPERYWYARQNTSTK